MYAPYQIQLDDGRLIFAPQDIDQVLFLEEMFYLNINSLTRQVIRLEGSVTHTAEELASADASHQEHEYDDYEGEDMEYDEGDAEEK
jgi:hypothetical protein